MTGFEKGNTVLVTKGAAKGLTGEYVGYTSATRALVRLEGTSKLINVPIDSIIVLCTHNKEEQEKEVEIKVGDKVKLKDSNDNAEFTITGTLTTDMLLLTDHYGYMYAANVKDLELIPQEEPKVNPDDVLDKVGVALVNSFKRLSVAVTVAVDEQIEELGYDGWAVTVSNMGVEQYVESLLNKYISN